MADIGHNGGEVLNTSAQEVLRTFVDRIERLNEEKAEIAEQTKEVFAEAKGQGFDTKALRKLISLRKMDPAKRRQESEILDLYAHALGLDLF